MQATALLCKPHRKQDQEGCKN